MAPKQVGQGWEEVPSQDQKRTWPQESATWTGDNNVDQPTTAFDPNAPYAARWGVSWQFPASVVTLFVASFTLALGHHLYYSSLEDTIVLSESQQSWATRIGTGFAFITKTGLTISVGIAGTQQLWRTLRHKAVSIDGIDGMFSVMSDPTALFKPGVLAHAKTLCLFALVSWFIPLMAVVAPSALSVKPRLGSNVTAMPVQTINMTDPSHWFTSSGPGYIHSPSIEVQRLFTAAYASNAIKPQPALFPNSSYDLQFWGPSYACQNLSDTIATQNERTWTSPNYTSLQDVWDHEIGNLLFGGRAATSISPYVYAAKAPEYLNNMIMIFAAGVNSQWGGRPQGSTNLTCQMYNTSYDITVNFDNGFQTIRENSVKRFARMDWNRTVGFNALTSPAKGADASVVSFWVTHMLFKNLLGGNITIGADGTLLSSANTDTLDVLQSGVSDCPEMWNNTLVTQSSVQWNTRQFGCPAGSMAHAIEQLSRNFTYSLLTFPYWVDTYNTSSVVTISTPQNVFVYNKWTLWSAYLTGLAVTLVCIAFGTLALFDNGVASSATFSSILFTTRNADLDTLGVGQCLGSTPLASEVGGVRLRFGAFETRHGYKHAAFGLDGSVEPLRKGEIYY
ncbi:hypothetical protein GQ53DRAFT_732685 [Thozetella sp. PMI_491]|nr:hypothetical protein GQ53DRAFT_732685 [Thozetella sp. PMI_491]